MNFIKNILGEAEYNNHLFISSLSIKIIEDLISINQTFRNEYSHASTYSKSQAKNIIEAYKIKLHTILSELIFLKSFNLVRYNEIEIKNKKYLIKGELFKGSIKKKEESEYEEIILCDSGHLILLEPADKKFIDLYPLYQMIENEKTNFQSLMFYAKSYSNSKQVLKGECIQIPINYDMEGVDKINFSITEI